MSIKIESAVSKKQILFCTDPQVSVGVRVADDSAETLLAGTPMTGDLEARGTAFTKATTTTDPETEVSTNNAVGILLHDVKLENGQGNAALLIFGFADLNKIDSTVSIDSAAKAALSGKVTYMK